MLKVAQNLGSEVGPEEIAGEILERKSKKIVESRHYAPTLAGL